MAVLMGLFAIHIAFSWFMIAKIEVRKADASRTFPQGQILATSTVSLPESAHFEKATTSKPVLKPKIVATSTEATVTAYSALDSCHLEHCLTASGKPAYIGGVACPTWYKLGSRVEINGKTYTCEDRTAVRFNGRFDIFMGYTAESHESALTFGKKSLEVKILK